MVSKGELLYRNAEETRRWVNRIFVVGSIFAGTILFMAVAGSTMAPKAVCGQRRGRHQRRFRGALRHALCTHEHSASESSGRIVGAGVLGPSRREPDHGPVRPVYYPDRIGR
jgi:hypothetical protein